MAKIDPRCYWVEAHDGERVKVDSVAYMDATQTQNRLGVYVFAMRRKIMQWCVPFQMILPGNPGSVDDFGTIPELVTDMLGGNFDPGKGQRGPFKFQMDDAWVDGLGLPLNRHVIYAITFTLVAPK